jgi:hypothetical protein
MNSKPKPGRQGFRIIQQRERGQSKHQGKKGEGDLERHADHQHGYNDTQPSAMWCRPFMQRSLVGMIKPAIPKAQAQGDDARTYPKGKNRRQPEIHSCRRLDD